MQNGKRRKERKADRGKRHRHDEGGMMSERRETNEGLFTQGNACKSFEIEKRLTSFVLHLFGDGRGDL